MHIIFTENSLVWPRMQGKKMFIRFNIAKEEECCVTVCTKKINAKRNHRTDKKCMITLFSISQKSRIICQLSLKKRHSTWIETTQIILKTSSASRHMYMYKLNILGIFSRERDTPSFCVANCALVIIYIYNILYIQIIASANWGKHW